MTARLRVTPPTVPSLHCDFFSCLGTGQAQEILDFLPLSDLVRIRSASVALRALSGTNWLWDAQGKREFPMEYRAEEAAEVKAAASVLFEETDQVQGRILPGARERVYRAAIILKTAQLGSLWKSLDLRRLDLLRTAHVGVRNSSAEAAQKSLDGLTSFEDRREASFLMAIRALDCQPLPSDFAVHFDENLGSRRDPLTQVWKKLGVLTPSNVAVHINPSKVTEIFFMVRTTIEHYQEIERKKCFALGVDPATRAAAEKAEGCLDFDDLYAMVISDAAKKLSISEDALRKGMSELPVTTSRKIFDEFKLIGAMLTYGVKIRCGIIPQGASLRRLIEEFAERGFYPTPQIYLNMLEFCDEAGSASSFKMDELVTLFTTLLKMEIAVPPEFKAKLEVFQGRSPIHRAVGAHLQREFRFRLDPIPPAAAAIAQLMALHSY